MADTRVERALTDALFLLANPTSIGIGGATGAGIFAVLQWSRKPDPSVLWWLGVHLLIVGFHTYLAIDYRADPDKHSLKVWKQLHTLALTFSGVIWGAGVLLYFDASDPIGTAFLMTFYAGLAAICVIAYSANIHAFIACLSLIAVPLVVRCFQAGSLGWYLTGASTTAFNILCLGASKRLREILVRNAELRFRNEDLAADLKQAYLAKNRFLAAAGHDLRQPLHAMNLFVELLGTAASEERPKFLERVQTSSRALEGLLNSLLDLSRIDADTLKPQKKHFALAPWLEQMHREYGEPAQKKGLLLQVKPLDVFIDSDPDLLGRVLRNLLSNAVRYTSEGTITLDARQRGMVVELSVADTGVGIPPDEQARVFEEFYQVGNPQRDREKGLGLGLSIVQGLCRVLGHPLKLISQPERLQGCELLVEVPIGDERAAAPVTPIVPVHALTGRRVLVLDDERDIRTGMEALLASWQCEAVCKGSLGEALEGNGEAPDLVICDFRLPDSTGLEALRQLEKKYGRALSALIVTGDTAPEQILQLKQCGRPLLFKPVMPGKLRAALNALAATTKR